MKPATAHFILTKILGWHPDPNFPKDKKALVLGVPHTSVWDFVIAFLYARSHNAPMRILVKENFFFWPVGPVIRKWGAIPLRKRSAAGGAGAIIQMVEAFKSTLEETRLTDIIVEVLDISAPGMEERHDTTMNVLKEIGADYRNSLLVLNKFDKLVDETERLRVMRRFPEGIPCSALTGEGLAGLAWVSPWGHRV